MGKSTLYAEAVRVPFVVHWTAGRLALGAVSEIAASVDVWPTIAGVTRTAHRLSQAPLGSQEAQLATEESVRHVDILS